ncbi:flavohemoglobin expression-modulating QEGLA motif protein [Salinimicrobium xinjiangense]|uniref:flavohemoglobin expression-modulating QEGLA motif protein n=1 Tax=Salinimicrobium xinjiangense TaxID=438596 RepID=UPI00040C19D4|nr:tyrosine/phenylalanine carboxypeptidase domain-containing protein [Salinimicrobium xinjiangense]
MELDTSKKLSPLGESSISEIIKELQEECEIEKHLPGGGYLHMSDELPYLVVYRNLDLDKDEVEDTATVRLILSEASFMVIGNKDFEGYQQLMFSLSDAMASKFKSFLILEVYAGDPESRKFRIKGPADKLSTTIKVFQEELDDVNSGYRALNLEQTEVIDTVDRQPEGKKPLLNVQQLKDAGCLLIGLEVPPVYRSKEGEDYPVFFRSFKDDFVKALHKTIFQFIRIQTSSGVKSYRALGQKNLQKKVIEIDRALAEIETSYQFLWLVSPANIRQIKDTFFESNYEKVLNYHYRLLPFDPDVLKRKLYNLKIEEVDDPAFSYIFREKREELDLQISMLTERGSDSFFYNSMMLYGKIPRNLQREAENILREIPEMENQDFESIMKAEDFKVLAEKEFEYFKDQDENFSSKVHVRDDVNILMVSQGELYLPSDYKLNANETFALIQHEIGTHVLTFYNGKQQPLKLLSIGLTDYDTLQEGLAVLSEYLVGGLSGNRMRTLAGRVVAASARMHGAEFQEIFRLLDDDYGFSEQRAFNITSRIMQGGGFTKDISYLKGLFQLKDYLAEGGELSPLLTGKFALEHLPIITELEERRVLKPNNLVPRYMESEETTEKISQIRKGISLSQLINA